MAINAIKFAKMISAFSSRHVITLNETEINNIFDDVQQIIEAEKKAVNLYPMFDAIVAGKKIDAIKAYRELTGEGLLESKNAIERLMSVKVS